MLSGNVRPSQGRLGIHSHMRPFFNICTRFKYYPKKLSSIGYIFSGCMFGQGCGNFMTSSIIASCSMSFPQHQMLLSSFITRRILILHFALQLGCMNSWKNYVLNVQGKLLPICDMGF